MVEQISKFLILLVFIIVSLGITILILFNFPFLSAHIGKLPGDFYFRGNGFILYFPITSGIIISLIVSLILYIFRKKIK